MFNQNTYGQYSSSSGNEPLAFYQGGSNYGGYSGQQSGGMGNSMGSMGSMGGGGYASGNMASGRIATGDGKWWEAFGTGGLEGEPSLMEGELARAMPLGVARLDNDEGTRATWLLRRELWLSLSRPDLR